ncbi:MAG: hypothetical protein AAF802_03025 [Planctomycetota bacterium]
MTSADNLAGGCVLEQTGLGWRLHVGSQVVGVGPEASLAEVASEVNTLLRSEKVSPRCVLALASSECFFATLETNDRAVGKDRTATRYELERHFPVDAESIVFDSWSLPSQSSARDAKGFAAVAADQDRLKPLIDSLEDLSIDLVAIVPTVSLISSAFMLDAAPGPTFALLIARQDTCDYVERCKEGIVRWKHWNEAASNLGKQISLVESEPGDADSLWVCGLTQEEFDSSEFHSQRHIVHYNESLDSCLRLSSGRILAGRWGSEPNLRRDAFAPRDPLVAVSKPLRVATIAAVMCGIVLIAASWFRTAKIQERSEAIRADQRSVFEEAFPGRRVPVLLMRTVRREHQQTMGSRGRGQAVDLPVPATSVLQDVLAGLAAAHEQARFRVLDCSIEDGDCSVTVRTRKAEEIGVIAKSLETIGLRVEPPATQQIPSSREEPIVTFQSTLSIRWNGSAGAGLQAENETEQDS